MTEKWRPVVGYEGLYEVSDLGRVRSLDHLIRSSYNAKRRHRGRVLAGRPKDSGHITICLARDGSRHTRQVHQLVLEAFVGPRPPGLEGCHGNGIPSDNRLVNLRWDTPSANRFDAVRHGTHYQTAKKECPQGHQYVTLTSGGRTRRDCRECALIRRRKRALAKSA